MPITKCTTHNEDKNEINYKYIVSVAKTLAEYFLSSYYTMFSLKIKPVGSFILLFIS